MDFLKDEEKMIDFFSMSKKDFLNSYSYLYESEYVSTVIKVCNKLGFDYERSTYETIEGNELLTIITSKVAYNFLKLI